LKTKNRENPGYTQQKTCHLEKFRHGIVPQAKLPCEHRQLRSISVRNLVFCTRRVRHCSLRSKDNFKRDWVSDRLFSSMLALYSISSRTIQIFSALQNMDNPEEILARARERAQKMNLPYAGALLPAEARALMQNLHGAKLVDVRTRAELEWVGSVPGSVAVEWNAWPGGARNPDFVAQLEQQVDKAATVMFLCRSGARSNAAAIAAMQAGYNKAYNVLEGFEGDKDDGGQRNKLGGWRAAGLPWTQS
jgi:rhodanese-related sulfurtransferase